MPFLNVVRTRLGGLVVAAAFGLDMACDRADELATLVTARRWPRYRGMR